jgi:mRNA-degrading endonuclease RelE of RelBE toxin-antitoxin system
MPPAGSPMERRWMCNYRIVYEIADRTRVVDVMRIAHEREAYEQTRAE